jgi:hypothetical protein
MQPLSAVFNRESNSYVLKNVNLWARHMTIITLQRTYDIDIDTDPYADYDVAKSDPGWVSPVFPPIFN